MTPNVRYLRLAGNVQEIDGKIWYNTYNEVQYTSILRRAPNVGKSERPRATLLAVAMNIGST